jgi:hypothetical protein
MRATSSCKLEIAVARLERSLARLLQNRSEMSLSIIVLLIIHALLYVTNVDCQQFPIPDDVASNFNVDSLVRSGLSIPPSSAHEPSGNFRFLCRASHLAADDPIVYPNQPGKSHLHHFFGTKN